VTSYLLSVNVTHDMDTLFWGSYSLSFICGHIGLCAFTFILVDQFCIMFYPCPSVFPSIMFWFTFNNLSLPWTWLNVLKFGCVKNHKRSVNFDLNKSGASVSHVHLFFFLIYFLLVKYMCKFANRLTHFSMYGSTTAIQKLFN
jgi:hypothetical protein